MSDRFTEKAENALNRSVKTAERLGHTYIGTEHILLSLTEDEMCCASLILKKNGIDRTKLFSVIKDYSGVGVKSKLSSKDLTPRARKILENSYTNAMQFGGGKIGTEHILLSLVEEKDSVAIKVLNILKTDLIGIRDDINTLIKNRERTIQNVKKDNVSPIMKQYGKNLCELARDGKFDPVIGRDKETDRVIRVLSRKNKNNPCLVGEAGVGKTAIVEGLAQRIVENNVPEALLGKTIISIDLTSMVAGAKYRGDFEDRIKNIVNEAIKNKDVILFIDEIHTIVGAGAAEGAIDASNILKPQLARGDIQIIGATTFDEYHRYIEKDAALERRFQPIRINEPTESETILMLKAIKERYEDHHGVKIEDSAIEECVLLSSKYISDRYLPDKAIDILDEACAMTANNSSNSVNSSNIIEQYIKNDENSNQRIIDINYITHAEYPRKDVVFKSKDRPVVDTATIKEVVSEACSIPTSLIKKAINYDELEIKLNKAVIGQKSAITKLVSAIKRSDLGFGKNERPRGIFLFVGESGVGKTALAIELAKNLFYDLSKLLRFDMSEYSEKHSISKLIGSAPGYVGHEEGGALTEAVKRNPHSVILFDEIEKADKEILNILLQISDNGYLSDSSGRRISFRNAIIIATSNLGASRSIEKVGFENSYTKQISSDILASLKKYYKEELINRFDAIIYFDSLSKKALEKIVIERLNDLQKSLNNKGYIFTYTDDIVANIVSKCKINGMGARPLIREIASEIESKIIDLILKKNDKIKFIEASLYRENIVINEKNVVKT